MLHSLVFVNAFWRFEAPYFLHFWVSSSLEQWNFWYSDMYSTVRHWSITWARWIQPTASSHFLFIHFNIIILENVLFCRCSDQNSVFVSRLSFACCMTIPSHPCCYCNQETTSCVKVKLCLLSKVNIVWRIPVLFSQTQSVHFDRNGARRNLPTTKKENHLVFLALFSFSCCLEIDVCWMSFGEEGTSRKCNVFVNSAESAWGFHNFNEGFVR